MSENIKVIVDRSELVDIANAVRSKTGTTGEMTTNEIANKISRISGSGGIILPELTEPATENEVFLDQEYIDSTGNKKTGTFTIDSEVTTQTALITQIATALEGKAAASGGGDASVETCSITITVDNYSNIYYTSFINGNYMFSYDSISSNGTKTIPNIVINSLITICYNTSQSAQRVEVTDNIVYDLSSFEYGGMLKTFGFHSSNAFGGTITIGSANASGGYGDGDYA